MRRLLLLAWLLMGVAQPSHASYAQVRLCPSGGITGGGNTGTTVSCGFASNGAGNLLVVWSSTQVASATATIADTTGNTYTTITNNVTSDGQSLHVWAAYSAISTGSTNTVTITWNTSSSHVYMGGAEYSGNATSNALDQTATASSSPTPAAPVSPNVTTTQGGELLVGVFAGGNGSNATVAAGSWTLIAATTNGCCSPGWEQQLNVAAGTYHAQFTDTGNAANGPTHISTYIPPAAVGGGAKKKKVIFY